jgi:3-oxoacyl-[acyl-carrier-protein] synthase II
MAIVIAAEEMSGRTLSVYRQLRLLSPGNGGNEVSCPFDSKRNGMILSEGAAAVILELAGEAKARGAVAQAQILGTGAAHDAAKAMGQNGTGLESAMRLALSDAHVSFDEVGYLAAAANSSRVLDAAEASAIRRVADGKLAQQLRVSSIRSMIGESFSAGALFNVAACVAAMHEGFIPPTVNYQHPDPHCELPLTSELLRQETRIAMANAASFGGNSASVVLGRCARNGVCQ